MRVRVIRIGNSRGLRIPKAILEQTGIRDEVEIEVEIDRIIVRPVQNARDGWDVAFQAMAAKGDDTLQMGDEVAESFDATEWEW